MSPKMTEIGLIRNNKKKQLKSVRYDFFLTNFLVHRKVRCPPKVAPKPTSTHIYIYRSSLNLWRQCITKQELILLISNLVAEATIVNTMTCKFNWFIL